MIGENKKCIGLIFGGYSNEHAVSISSAKTVFKAFNSEINKKRFTIKAFYINKYGDWLESDFSLLFSSSLMSIFSERSLSSQSPNLLI